MNRRASRKLNEANRQLRRKKGEVAALASNLQSAFKAITAQRDRLRELQKSQPGAIPAAT